jgi:hypothetical protein
MAFGHVFEILNLICEANTTIVHFQLSIVHCEQRPKKPLNRCPFAVPDKIFGLTLILDFIDRGTHCALAVSATGSARARGRGEIFSQDKQQGEP